MRTFYLLVKYFYIRFFKDAQKTGHGFNVLIKHFINVWFNIGFEFTAQNEFCQFDAGSNFDIRQLANSQTNHKHISVESNIKTVRKMCACQENVMKYG